MTDVAFAIPGDLSIRTGGYAYDRAILAGLGVAGINVSHLPLGGSFPEPTDADVSGAIDALVALPETTVAFVDALAYAVLPPEGLRQVSAPIVALVHHPLADETGLTETARAAFTRSETAALACARAVVTTSQTTADILADRFAVPADRITVALPGLDRAAFQDNAPTDPPALLSIGTLIPRKGFDVLFAALKQLTDLPFTAEIVGGDTRHPTEPARLKALAATPPLSGRITFHGECDTATIRALMRHASVFCLASRNEGFGMVFAEAMAASLPVVGCRAGAVPEVVPEGTGLLVPVDDADELAAALRRLLTDRALRDRTAAAARARAERLPSWQDSADTIAALLARVAGAAAR